MGRNKQKSIIYVACRTTFYFRVRLLISSISRLVVKVNKAAPFLTFFLLVKYDMNIIMDVCVILTLLLIREIQQASGKRSVFECSEAVPYGNHQL